MPQDRCPCEGIMALTRGVCKKCFHFFVAIIFCLVLVLSNSLQSLSLPSDSTSSIPAPAYPPSEGTPTKMGSKNHCQYPEKKKCDVSSLRCALKLLNADFLNDTKILEIKNGAKELNIPIMKANRKHVASVNGGLQYPSSLVFSPDWGNQQVTSESKRFNYPSLSGIQKPENEEDIAFMSVLELAELIKAKQITSQELTHIFLQRLKKYNPILEAVVTYTEDLAYKQAKEADELLGQGVYLGPLHGIPYGLKDLIAVPKYKTTWGSKSFKDQVLDVEAWVYKRLKNPWNIEEFTTGSSAGPAACTSAGMVPFAIGSETAGSITYPAARCGVTALRPTFGSVGRSGVMSISESLDKLGPFCRTATDCSVILDAIRGKDPDDPSSRDTPLDDPFLVDITKLTVGYLEDAEMEVVHVLASMGVNTAHFDEWQRSGLDDEYEAQDQWPTELRRARIIPAVDYIQAQRARGKLIREFPQGLTNISNPPPGGSLRRTTVTTGIYAPPQCDHIALALAMAYQSATNHHNQRPPINDLGPNDSIPDPPTVIYPPRVLRL
ncbi:Glutamyl-tRNA(Gln) amidotransferase subunit A [Quillaja saponaria]|uniref:Glutamyl-tRNA(Gln) amidotransferase subunit A n=1 Tax=Quillaja saponaria TaxID=32244 RepID=A0AAD7LFB2_QUISA|nr:Glutamyl-tRNA(Gln) amidotransferase subunit A [Quillaja saponaria]